jgi:hypothetical protein
MGDFWADIQQFGVSAFESIGENIGKVTDAYVDSEIQKANGKAASPQLQKEAEPTKGKNVQGQPIVVAGTGVQSSMLDNKTLLMIGGGLAALIVTVLLVRR